MIKPNFFIVGAPKCGTSALYYYLSTHPNIYLSRPKEPNFFCDDFSYKIRRWQSEEQYLQICFGGANESYPVVGEGSVLYLYSSRALPRIREFNPDSKIIIMLRDPVDMVLSWHNHLVYFRYEKEKDFATAWNLQHERKKGLKIPKLCPDPSFLQYKEVCSLGKQVSKAYSIFPSSQILTILFKDFKKAPYVVYKSVLEFLDLPDDGRCEFPPVNQAKRNRSGWIADTIALLNHLKRNSSIWPVIKRSIKIRNVRLLGIIKRLNTRRERQRPSLSPNLREHIAQEFQSDADLLHNLLNKEQDHSQHIQ